MTTPHSDPNIAKLANMTEEEVDAELWSVEDQMGKLNEEMRHGLMEQAAGHYDVMSLLWSSYKEGKDIAMGEEHMSEALQEECFKDFLRRVSPDEYKRFDSARRKVHGLRDRHGRCYSKQAQLRRKNA
jgi:hypothetical protein